MDLETIELDSWHAVIEEFHERRWTDGLPIIPPEPELVDAMVAGGHRAADELVGFLPEREKSLHVWQAAVSAVMAGCKPEYFPVVLATWEAVFQKPFNLHAVLSSTGGAAITGVVSGPYADKIGMNSGSSLFGPGNRANASIGRAIRLGAISTLGAVPGVLDASSLSHGGKYTMHFSERTPPDGWPTIREQLGYPVEATTVTVLPVEAPRQIMQRLNKTVDGTLATFAACMKNPSQNGAGKGTYYIIILGPEHAGVFADGGLSPADVRAELAERSKFTEAELAAAGILLDNAGAYSMIPDAEGKLPVARAEHILVVTAGGAGAGWSAAIPCWTGTVNSHPTTSAVVADGAPTEPIRDADPTLDYR
jgi:hypothetical protein